MIIDDDVTAFVQLDSGLIQSKIVRIWAAAYSEQHMSAANL